MTDDKFVDKLDDKFKNISVIQNPGVDSHLSSKAKFGIVNRLGFHADAPSEETSYTTPV